MGNLLGTAGHVLAMMPKVSRGLGDIPSNRMAFEHGLTLDLSKESFDCTYIPEGMIMQFQLACVGGLSEDHACAMVSLIRIIRAHLFAHLIRRGGLASPTVDKFRLTSSLAPRIPCIPCLTYFVPCPPADTPEAKRAGRLVVSSC